MATATTNDRPRNTRKRRVQPVNDAVDDVAGDLGMDVTAHPDEAALDESAAAGSEAAAAAAFTDGADVPEISVQNEAPNLEEEEERELDEPPPAQTQEPVTSRRMDNTLQPQQVPLPRKTKQQLREEREAARLHQQQQGTSPVTKRLGGLGAKLPGAEHVKVHKRLDNGKLAYVGEYSIRDLAQSQDIETFLNLYVKPHHGAGEYQLTGVDARGMTFDAGSTTLLGGPTGGMPTGGLGPLELLREVLFKQSQPAPQPMRQTGQERDPVQDLRRLRELQKEFDADLPKGSDAATAAISMFGRSQAATMEMMMAMQAKSDQRFTEMMQLMSKKETDPTMMLLLTMLMEDRKSSGGGSSMPMPPPLPPPNPFEGIKEVAALITALHPPQPQQPPMTFADVLALAKELRGDGGRGSDDFRKTAENMTAMHQLMGMMSGGGGGWAEAVGAIANSPLMASLASGINARNSARRGVAPAQVMQPPQNAATELQQRANALRERQMRIAERQLEQQEITLGLRAGTPQEHQAPAEPEYTQEEQAARKRVQQANNGKIPPLPPDIGRYTNALVMAEDDGKLMAAVVELIGFLMQHEYWDRLGNVIMQAVANEEKELAVRYVDALFTGLVKIQLVTTELRNRVFEVLETHWPVIVQHVQQLVPQQQRSPQEIVEEAFESPNDEDEDDEDAMDTDGLFEDV